MPTTPAAALDPLLCFDLYAASRAVTARYRPLLDDLGLTYPQHLVLTLLHDRPHMAVKEIASALRLDHGTLTPLLRRMEQSGLLSRARSESDERIVLITSTPLGESLYARFDEVHCTMAEAMGLTPDQAAELQVRLRTLVDNVEVSER